MRADDLAALAAVGCGEAAELSAPGWPAWQLLAGALSGTAVTAEVRYCAAPFGVTYLVAALRSAGQDDAGGHDVA